MAKDESGRLFSKVAKFVRNPLKDWSELGETTAAAATEDGYSREALKEMIERRQRNDFVRRREFDMLRKMRQRVAEGAETTAQSSSFGMPGKVEGRALTLKKIDEIEEQMSQQWWKAAPPAKASAGKPTVPTDDSGQADSVLDSRAPGRDGGEDSANRMSQLNGSTAIEEASVRFAHGDNDGCEAILMQTIAPDSAQADNEDNWRTLLDLHRATGDVEKFERIRTRFVQRFGRIGPTFLSIRALARDAQKLAEQRKEQAGPRLGGADWRAPAALGREGLINLTQALGAAGPVWTMDWSALESIAIEAAYPLKALFQHWADSPVQLRFMGSERLLDVLAEATPMNARDTATIWWELRLAVLRAMNDGDSFEMAALNYCLTFEVSPPAWEEPNGSYASADKASAPKPVAMQLQSDGASSAAAPVLLEAVLSGDLAGESLSTWMRLDDEMAGAQTMVISCAALVRLDLTAAGSLLNWVTARDERGERVEFVEAHRLVAEFFKAIGIADHATIALRRD